LDLLFRGVIAQVIANDSSTFESDSIKFSIIGKDGTVQDFPQQHKDQAAHAILDKVLECTQK